MICMIFAFVKAGAYDSLAAIAEGFSPDVRKFLSFKAWAFAILHVSVIVIIFYIRRSASAYFDNKQKKKNPKTPSEISIR